MSYFTYFVSYEVTYGDGRAERGNADYTIEVGIENIDDVRSIESNLGEQLGGTVVLLNFRPFLIGAGESAGQTETTTETTTVIEDDGPAWGSRY